ncbi:MAG: ABC transporter ATP-binding protein [Bacteroidetes bacterium]|nr:ABC transporter ATP-binding protein [Bacteroidota bacterium]
MNEFSLECKSLEKRYLNRVIFRNFNETLKAGDSLAITGRNGSGKSTLLKIIANLIKPDRGTVTMTDNGSEINHDKRHFHTGMIAPYINLYEELTAYENLSFFYDLKSPGGKDKKERIGFLLEKVKLYSRRNDEVKNFSSGMKQRVKLAFAVINSPRLLLMDEPRTNLDTEGVDLVYGVAEEQKKNGILIIATNEPEDTGICGRTASIEDFKQ